MPGEEKLRALVVEDEPETALQLGKILEKKFSLEVETAGDCATARKKLAGGRFDIMTLDFMLPDGRGLDFLEEITKVDSGIRVIMVTGHGDEETAVRSFRSSASGYVVKDVHLHARLVEAVENALTEINLRAAQEELHRREEHFRSLIEKATDLITVIEPDGTIMYESPAIERLLGYKLNDLAEMNAFDLVHPDDLPRIMGLIGQGLSTPGASAVAEYRVKHKDGPWRIFESHGRNLMEDPAVGGLVINSHDITERKRNEERLRRYRDELEQLVDERTAELAEANVQLQQEVTERKQAEAELKQRAERLADFLTVTSHELRHPVSVVKGYTTMLAGYLERMKPDDLRSLLDALDVSVDRLTGLVEELMEVSLVEQGRFTFEKTSADVGLLVQTAVADMKARGLDNEITSRVSDGSERAIADPDKLARLLIILLDNACKFSPPSSPIEIEVERDNNNIVVSVLDRGIGVPGDLQELIFDRFYQVEEVKHHSSVGLGLGLYLAKQIASAHNGQIRHLPREGGGSIFRFTLEAWPAEGGNRS